MQRQLSTASLDAKKTKSRSQQGGKVEAPACSILALLIYSTPTCLHPKAGKCSFSCSVHNSLAGCLQLPSSWIGGLVVKEGSSIYPPQVQIPKPRTQTTGEGFPDSWRQLHNMAPLSLLSQAAGHRRRRCGPPKGKAA